MGRLGGEGSLGHSLLPSGLEGIARVGDVDVGACVCV